MTQEGGYTAKVLAKQHFDFIQKFYKEHISENMSTKKMRNMISKQPVELIDILVQRLETHQNELKQEKAEKIAEWKQLCESNFFKSLDHRSFFFKKEQKDVLPIRK